MGQTLINSENPVSALLNQALEIDDPEQRQEYLKQVCGENRELFEEVESLLNFASILDEYKEEDLLLIGQQVGKFKVEKEIGRGGMGAVYLGKRSETYQQLGAIKVIKRGLLNEAGIRDFSKEIKKQARLNHRNIAKLLDAGITDDKMPYFVMEYIDGKRIDEFCDLNHFTTKKRLELFLKVCEVVQYVHEANIMHRDLKPQNILIDKNGEPKLIDFGIAKIINSTLAENITVDLATQIKRALSPDYASPEQFNGNPNIDKTSDIYSLGAVLYQLISGHPAHQFKSDDLSEMERVICKDQPIKPSKVIFNTEKISENSKVVSSQKLTIESICAVRECQPKQLRDELVGDLDSIVMKALRKEPHHRYEDVTALADDVTNYLVGKPVKARSGSWWYRFDKYASRFFSHLPPFSTRWIPKLAIYLTVVMLFLTLWNYQTISVLTRTTVHWFNQTPESLQNFSVSEPQKQQLKKAEERITFHLSHELITRSRNPTPWTMAQIIIALKGRAEIDENVVYNLFLNDLDANCNCWKEGKDGAGHQSVTSWVLIALSRLGKQASKEQIQTFLDNQIKPGGWWTTYPASSENVFASTYATAISVLALREQLQVGLENSEQENKVKEAIKLGRSWLLQTHKGNARWSDYPFNDDQKESVGMSGLVLHVLHQTDSSNTQNLQELDQLWLKNLPFIGTDAKDKVQSVIFSMGNTDAIKNYTAQWAIIGTVDAYQNGTAYQKAKTRAWMDIFVFNNIEELTESVIGEMDWTAAELLNAFRYLDGDKSI
jgi:serine/threonine protein kinase